MDEEELEPRHKRPGTPIGDMRDGSGLNTMVRELVSNAIAEVLMVGAFSDRS